MQEPGVMSLGRAMVALSCVSLGERERGRLREMAKEGYDAFGLHPAGVAAGLALTLPWYRAWFRVSSRGIENMPAHGATILAANHGGLLPFDALMLWADVVLRSDPPRVPRFVMDNFVPRLPVVSTVFARAGAVGGSRANVHHLLARGELLALFPEGVGGVAKPWSQRCKLQAWSVGHAEMAIRHGAPVVPVAIVGPDEQFPFAVRLPLRLFGAPYLPLALPPWPLPVRYRIVYGDPIDLHLRFRPAQADLPDVVAGAAAEVRGALQALLDRKRAEAS